MSTSASWRIGSLLCCLLLGATLLPFAGCSASAPSTRIDHLARSRGLDRSVVEGDDFEHVVYEKPGTTGEGPLHIYLEGDGSPWLGETRISSDPTPRRAFALELMALDPQPSAYIGRPCYHGQQISQACNPALWTEQRYSPQIVASLEAAIRRVAAARSLNGLVLIGYSGGGVLAMLLAERLTDTRAIVTVAANLDIDAWTDLHGYSPLAGSLNPASRSPIPSAIHQFHLGGAADEQVPPRIIEPVATRQADNLYLVYPQFDHTCCWLEVWPEILQQVASSLP